jgi:hypothetical protein
LLIQPANDFEALVLSGAPSFLQLSLFIKRSLLIQEQKIRKQSLL